MPNFQWLSFRCQLSICAAELVWSDRFDLVQGKINLFKALGGENIRKR
jgi:hypothetical protein